MTEQDSHEETALELAEVTAENMTRAAKSLETDRKHDALRDAGQLKLF